IRRSASWRQIVVPAKAASARELLLLRERAETEPGLYFCGELPVASQVHAFAAERRPYRVDPHPDRGHRPQIGRDVEVDIETRVDRAQIDPGIRIDQQPPRALSGREPRLLHLDNAAPPRP